MIALDKLRALAAAATSGGPWVARTGMIVSRDPEAIARQLEHHRRAWPDDDAGADLLKWYDGCALVAESMHTADAAFVVEMRNAAPELFGKLEAAEHEIRQLREQVDALQRLRRVCDRCGQEILGPRR